MTRAQRLLSTALIVFLCAPSFRGLPGYSAESGQEAVKEYGPYHGIFLPGGLGLKKPIHPQGAPTGPADTWSMYCWVRSDEPYPERTLLAGLGEPMAATETQRYFAVMDGRLAFWTGSDSMAASTALHPAEWVMLTATYDGTTLRLYRQGDEAAARACQFKSVTPVMQLAPQPLPWPEGEHFGGKIAYFTLTDRVLSVDQIRALLTPVVPLDVLPFEPGSKSWPVSTRATLGLRAPQDPASLPNPQNPASLMIPARAASPLREDNKSTLAPRAPNAWVLANGWRLEETAKVAADGGSLSRAGFGTSGWLHATVPGTVLTTLIDQGIYPDPDYGLNNLLIPESLNKQDYWYRTEFTPPATLKDRRLTLTFEGINYTADVWMNGKRLGNIRGAFIRGSFDVTNVVEPGKPNALAVRISPPPHPGIPHEQSLKAGAGLNGGMLCLDGPTFICTEGWDWLPGIRDRNTWAPNSGRLLWMSQPAWPSMSWQLFSHDYDTHGAYYGAKKACEPIHVQLNLPDLTTMVVDNTTGTLDNLSLTARVFSFDGKPVVTRNARVSVSAGASVPGFPLELPMEAAAGVSFISLELRDAKGALLSQNFYWYAAQPASYRRLAELPGASVAVHASQRLSGGWVRVSVDLNNQGDSIALMTKVTLRLANAGARVLPAYASDNYISLLPGESRRIEYECPASLIHGALEIAVEGWNVHPIAVLCRQSSGG